MHFKCMHLNSGVDFNRGIHGYRAKDMHKNLQDCMRRDSLLWGRNEWQIYMWLTSLQDQLGRLMN